MGCHSDGRSQRENDCIVSVYAVDSLSTLVTLLNRMDLFVGRATHDTPHFVYGVDDGEFV
jgi:hypothetical protein